MAEEPEVGQIGHILTQAEEDTEERDAEDAEDAEDAHDAEAPDPDEMRAALGGVATGLAEQLTTITQEVNKIREELYGNSGIGGIAQELEKMKAGSLGNLLEDTDIPGVSDGVRQRPAQAKSKGGGRGSPFSLERERKLEELRRRIEDRHTRERKGEKEGFGFMEWLVILFVIFVIAYTALPSFRVQVRHTFQELVLGEVPEVVEEAQDFGAFVEEDTDSFF